MVEDSQLVFFCSKSTREPPEQCMKSIQSCRHQSDISDIVLMI